MARAAPIQTAFNSGELSPHMEGRVDVAKYANGCKTLENFIPLVQGPAMRRAGTRFVSEIKDSSKRSWLIRFEFNTAQAYQLEFGDKYIRFYKNHAPVTVSSASAWVSLHDYVVGDLVSNGGIYYYCVTAHNSAVFAVDLANGYWYALSGNIYEIPTPYSYTDLTNSDGTFALKFSESNDIVYLCHPSYQQIKLSRYGDTNWTLTYLTPTNGPFKDINSTTTTVWSSAQTGSATVTASANIFTANMVGSLFYIQQKTVLAINQWQSGTAFGAGARARSSGVNYVTTAGGTSGGSKPIHTEGTVNDGSPGIAWKFEDPGYGYGIITGYTSPTQVTINIISAIPFYAVGAGNPTTKWAFGAWSSVEGWPSQVTFFKERLTFGRGQQVWLSVSGDYENFSSKDPTGVVTADMAISITLVADKVNTLQWFASMDSLICGTAGGEFAIQSITTNQPFGPDNVTAPLVSSYGSRYVRPLRIAEVVLFVQRSGLRVRDLTYDYLSNVFKSADQNVFADHITQSGVIQMAYQQEPYSLCWMIRADGQLICMTYSREQYESPPYGGWHRHPVGGNGFVESLSVIPAPNGDRDELWMIVRRTINGVTKRYIEYMEYDYKAGDTQASAFYVDCGLSYSGLPITHVTGLNHLIGKSVAILADGAAQPSRTVAVDGSIDLDISASVINAGLPYSSKLQTMRLNAGGQDGTSQGKTSRINKLSIRFYNALGVLFGSSFTNLFNVYFRTIADGNNNPPALFTGDKLVDFSADYGTDPWVCLQVDDPLPATITAIMPIVSTQDRS